MVYTIKDVAKLAGVGVATVSRTINNTGYVKPETREKVFQAVRELNYTPNAIARNLVSSRSNIIGVVIPDITNPFFSFIIQGITQVLNQTGYELIFYNTNEDPVREHSALNMLMENRVRGIIFTPVAETNQQTADILARIQASQVPIVMVDRILEHMECDVVLTDNVTASAEMTRLLISNGHKKIAVIHGPVNTVPGRDRLKGFHQGCESMKLPVSGDLIYPSSFLVEGGAKAAEEILRNQKSKPTAIFCCNNLISIGCLQVIKRHGIRVPDEISVVGFDEIEPYGVSFNSFTHVARSSSEMGRLATHTLLSRISNHETPINRIVLQAHLDVRGSEKYPQTPYYSRTGNSI